MNNSNSDCIFCKIVKGEIPCHKIYEDEDFLAFLDIHPETPGHTLIITKKHFKTMLDLPEDLLCKIIKKVQKITKVVLDITGYKAFNLVVNTGKDAGQLVDHVHFHIIPRIEGDDRKFYIPPIKYKNKQEIKKLATKIKNSL